jgi:hypothetical protein
LFLLAKQTNPNQSNRRSTFSDTSLFSIPCFKCSWAEFLKKVHPFDGPIKALSALPKNFRLENVSIQQIVDSI